MCQQTYAKYIAPCGRPPLDAPLSNVRRRLAGPALPRRAQVWHAAARKLNSDDVVDGLDALSGVAAYNY